MVNKKILFLFFVGMVFLIVVSGFADSWSVQKKIDWGGGLFEWNSNYFYSGSKNVLSCETFWGDSSKTAWHVDGNYWKGYECNKVDGGCVYSCTMNWELDASVNYLSAEITCIDSDNDNAYSNSGTYCSPADCDDGNVNIYPGAAETCGNNIDEDCVGGDLVCSGLPPVSCSDIIDIDGDGFGLTGGGICNWQIDCDDSVNGADGIAGNADDGANRYPEATEICDGIDNDCSGGYAANENIHSTTGTENSLSSCADGFDNDCDGLIDCADLNSCPQTNCIPCTDADNDNYCLESSGANCISTNVCAAFGDCDDSVNGADGIAGNADDGANRYPEATEICDDGIDNDCDTYTDFYDLFCQRAYWASDSQGDNPITTGINADGLQKVYLISREPFDLDLTTYEFEIYEKDSSGGDDAIRTDALGNKLTKTDLWDRIVAEWTITQADITKAATDDSSDNVYEFYFNVYASTPSEIVFQSPILIVDWTPAPCTSGTQSCYTGALETEGIGVCIGGTQDCTNSVWGVCQGEIKPTTEICGDGKDNDCDDEVDEETCSPTPVDCAQYQLCFDADSETACTEADSCGVSSLNGCLWNSGVCNPYEDLVDNSNNVIGQCVYTEDITDTCEDGGTLTYSLTTLTQGCEDKKDVSIFCSAQTSLPLENKFGIFLTIISIIGIYFIFFRIKKILKYKK